MPPMRVKPVPMRMIVLLVITSALKRGQGRAHFKQGRLVRDDRFQLR